MTARQAPSSLRRRVTLAFASVTPLGALAFHLGAGPSAEAHPAWLGATLAFCSGTFLCIACADLLPELQFHSHDRLTLTAALLAGIGTAWLIVRLAHGAPDPPHGHGVVPATTAPDGPAAVRPGGGAPASPARAVTHGISSVAIAGPVMARPPGLS